MKAGASVYLDKPMGLLQLPEIVTALLRQRESKLIEATIAEIAALREAADEYIAEIGSRTQEYSEAIMRANEHLFRARAYQAFMDSGGIRAEFQRLWPEALQEIARDREPVPSPT
jgi:hypothetical protein